MTIVTLDQVIDSAMQLSSDQREMLVSILHNRQIEERRHEIAQDAQESLAAYRLKKSKAQSVEEVIRELQATLKDDE